MKNLEEIKVGRRVMVEGIVTKVDSNGVYINIRDGDLPPLPPIGEHYFSFLQGIRECPPICSQCGCDIVKSGQTFRCENCGGTSGCS